MKSKVIVVSAIVLTAVSLAVLSADRVFLHDIAENQPVSETMMTITPVQVVNLPTETTGELKVQPTKTHVLDLLDVPVTLNFGDDWQSETFEVEKYTRLFARMEGLGSGIQCDVRWAWFEGDTFWGPGLVGGPLTGGNQARFVDVSGTHARISCGIYLSGTQYTVNDVKVLLRRE